MYDELTHIESIYGSVAEYNRVKYEEQNEYYTPTADELLKVYYDAEVCRRKIELLNGTPSALVESLLKKYAASEPKHDTADVYAYCDWKYETLKDALQELGKLYNFKYDEDWKTFYDTVVGTFAISVQYEHHPWIFHKHIGNLDYETFKNIFRDLHYLKFSPTMHYRRDEGTKMILSNCSLGELRIYDLKMAGVENQESLDKELHELGFDEEAYRKQILRNEV